MTWNHGTVEELLAGHALRALDPEDGALAERALVEHVPDCARCRRALDAYRAVAGDLALATAPVEPPPVLWAGLRRLTEPRPRAAAPWLGRAAVAAAVAAALVGLAAWNLLLAERLDRAAATQALMADAVAAVGRPDASVVVMEAPRGTRASMIYVHEDRSAYLVASGLPEPEGVYQLWLVTEGGVLSRGTFRPHGGLALVRTLADVEGIRAVMVTEEPMGGSVRPTGRPVIEADIGRNGG